MSVNRWQDMRSLGSPPPPFLLIVCTLDTLNEGAGGKGQVVPEERPLHIMCVWKDRNLSLTSHRQLSTYSFEVCLVVLLLPLLLLLLDCVSGGVVVVLEHPCLVIHSNRLRDWMKRTPLSSSVCQLCFILLAFSSSCWCSSSADAVDTAAQYNVTVQLMSSPGQNVNRVQ